MTQRMWRRLTSHAAEDEPRIEQRVRVGKRKMKAIVLLDGQVVCGQGAVTKI